MLLQDVTTGGAFPLLEKTLAFAQARNRVLAENIANVTTPGYRAKQLDVASFQEALAEASAKRKPGGKFELGETDEVTLDGDGRLRVTPSVTPTQNLLFHDGTNGSIERQMAELAENTMTHQAAAELLKGYFDGVSKAIRGRVQ
ncbi:MAG: flagellar basal body rod protein FlgB [Phycisphaerales bacterium]|nr:flagellar basal body rod protein FlgB [Phycisphaerales bacterium]